MTRPPRHIVGRTNCLSIAECVAAYLNERFSLIGAIVEPSGDSRISKYLILCEGPITVHTASMFVEACRAYLAAAEAEEDLPSAEECELDGIRGLGRLAGGE